MTKNRDISKKQQKFLSEFLATKSLEELLSLYTIAVSNNPEIFTFLPEDLIDPIRISLAHIQTFLPTGRKIAKSDFNDEQIKRNLRDLSGYELLFNFFLAATGDTSKYEQIPESLRTANEQLLDELRLCITGKRGLFSNDFNPEEFIDEFIKYAGGKRVTSIVGDGVTGKNADYFFGEDNVIIELKILESDFLATNAKKLKAAQSEYLKTAKISGDVILGKIPSYPRELFNAHFIILRDALKKITKTANKQIRNTKVILNSDQSRGVVIFLIDGFYTVNPYLIANLLHEPVSREFSSVDVIIFLSFRRKVTIDQGDGPFDYFVYEPRYKISPPESLSDFIDRLGAQWFHYLEMLSGKRFAKHFLSKDSQNLSKATWKKGIGFN